MYEFVLVWWIFLGTFWNLTNEYFQSVNLYPRPIIYPISLSKLTLRSNTIPSMIICAFTHVSAQKLLISLSLIALLLILHSGNFRSPIIQSYVFNTDKVHFDSQFSINFGYVCFTQTVYIVLAADMIDNDYLLILVSRRCSAVCLHQISLTIIHDI